MDKVLAAAFGAVFGAIVKYVHERLIDRSRPQVSVLGISIVTQLPDSTKDTLASFPVDLATRYNTSPVLPGTIDFSKSIPLSAYVSQVKTIRESVRIALGHQRQAYTNFATLFHALDRKDPKKFIEAFQAHDEVLWGWLFGRAKRRATPSFVPEQVIPLEAMKAIDGVAIRVTQKGDYAINVMGNVLPVMLRWSSTSQVPSIAELGQRLASAVARDIAEFQVEALRAMLGAVESDLAETLEGLEQLLQSIVAEEQRYAFLEVTALLRNRGRRAYATDSTGRLFVLGKGYSYGDGTGQAVTIAEDISVDLMADATSGSMEVVNPGDATVVRFLSKVPFVDLAQHEDLQSLSQHGERGCSLGLRLFQENSSPQEAYTTFTPFRTFSVGGPLIPPPPQAVLKRT